MMPEAIRELLDRNEAASRDKAALRFQSLRPFLKTNGSRRCACGKTISANKRQCFACSQKKEAA